MIEGFWRTWEGHVLYVLEHDLRTQKVLCDSPTGKQTFPESYFLSDKVDIGELGDITWGQAPKPNLKPCVEKIIGFNFLRGSGHMSEISPRLEKR